jgi:hypothetical protein
VRFAFIAPAKAIFPIAWMCRMPAVSRAGFYAWRQRPVAPRTRQAPVLALASRRELRRAPRSRWPSAGGRWSCVGAAR